MVPSWTETLIACGAQVVGRTRFCIHPAEKVKTISVVGGTKDIDWEKLEALKPDLLILDQEENPKSMARPEISAFHATHVTSVQDLPFELTSLADAFSQAGEFKVAERLQELSDRWERVNQAPMPAPSWERLSGLVKWISVPSCTPQEARIVYVIWKNPWMAAAPGTFIASVLQRLGWKTEQIWPGAPAENRSGLYPAFEIEALASKSDVLLCSSEPFPFHKKVRELEALGRPCAVVDGESFSWFGLRSLNFLERELSWASE